MSGTRNPAKTRARQRTDRRPPRARTGFEVLASKVEVPELRRGLVSRPALISRLRTSKNARVVSLAAPAGYGKTTLLAQWAAEDPRPFAWISLESRDNDPASFLTYLVAAIDGIQPVDAGIFRAAASGGDSLWSTGLPCVGAALAALQKPVVIVLDDVHELENRDCLDALEPIAKHLPDGSLLVLSGRAEDGLPLARLRAAGQLLEVGRSELALTDTEARVLLAASGLEVSDEEARSLNERAEGWAAGLYLAALFAEEAGTEELSSFAGDDKFVADYLRSEHLSRLNRSEIEFLTRTSILDRMSGPLCDELLRRTDSARRLEALEHANFFLVPLDHQRQWYRYHHLFRDMLRSELYRLEPEQTSELHGRAAGWCERNGLPDAAVEHAAAAGDIGEVARLVGMFALPYYRSGRVVTVEGWFSWFDEPGILARYPAIAAFGACINALRGRPEEADRYAFALDHTEYDGPMPDGSQSTRSWQAFVRALLCRHGVAEMKRDAERALRELSPSSYWRPIALGLLGAALLFAGKAERAEKLLVEAADDATGSGANWAGVVARSELALLALTRKELERAEAELAGARVLLENQPVEQYVGSVIYLAARARLALARGQGATARRLLVRAMRIRPQLSHAFPWYSVQARLELAKAHLALGDVDGARTLSREVGDVLSRRPELGTLVTQAQELRNQLLTAARLDDGWASTLTAAELRLLPLLTTHLSFREIAERLYVSRNTVKSQAISVYRKLNASSRSEAIERALELGLVDAPVASGSLFTPAG